MPNGFFGQYLQKGSKTEKKKEHHHQTLHNQISVGSKFQLRQTILIF